MGQELQTIIKDVVLPWGPSWKSTGKCQTQRYAHKKNRERENESTKTSEQGRSRKTQTKKSTQN